MLFAPDRWRSARARARATHWSPRQLFLVLSQRPKPAKPAPGRPVLPFGTTRAPSVCRTRAARREVLFARKVAGRRGSAPGPYRRTLDSQVRC